MCYYLNIHFQGQRVKINLKEITFDGMDWIHVVQVGRAGGIFESRTENPDSIQEDNSLSRQ